LKQNKLLCLLVLLLLSAGCKKNVIPQGEVKATVIEYKVDYLAEKAGKIPTKLLPGKMTVIFADHYAMNRIEGFFGQFSLIYVGNLRNQTVITMLKLFDKKFVYYGKKGELPCGLVDKGNVEITKTGKTAELVGYHCQQLLIRPENDSSFLALTTDKIDIKNPNITTPYRDISEVMLQFRTQLDLLEMQLTAENIEQKSVSWDVFRVTPDYEERSRDFMENTLADLFK
jgi:hypothetical protein